MKGTGAYGKYYTFPISPPRKWHPVLYGKRLQYHSPEWDSSQYKGRRDQNRYNTIYKDQGYQNVKHA
jgi:hypothetical protein